MAASLRVAAAASLHTHHATSRSFPSFMPAQMIMQTPPQPRTCTSLHRQDVGRGPVVHMSTLGCGQVYPQASRSLPTRSCCCCCYDPYPLVLQHHHPLLPAGIPATKTPGYGQDGLGPHTSLDQLSSLPGGGRQEGASSGGWDGRQRRGKFTRSHTGNGALHAVSMRGGSDYSLLALWWGCM